jgi:hypothetical protein
MPWNLPIVKRDNVISIWDKKQGEAVRSQRSEVGLDYGRRLRWIIGVFESCSVLVAALVYRKRKLPLCV